MVLESEMGEVATLQLPRALRVPRRSISIQLLNGDEIELGPCSTVIDLKAHAASHLKHFAPETCVFTLEQEPFVASDHEAAPQRSIVVMNPGATRDDAFWLKTLVAHANAGDGRGVANAMRLLRAENPTRACSIGSRSIQACCRSRQTSLNAVSLLFNTNAEVDCGGVGEPTSLWWAAKQGHSDIVEYLLEVGRAEVDRPAFRGTTPLLIATRFRHLHVVETLLANGANVHHTDDQGCTALMMCTRSAHIPILKLLITHHADVLQMNNDGDTALSIAAYSGHRCLMDAFLDAEVNVNHPSADQCTAVCKATKHHPIARASTASRMCQR